MAELISTATMRSIAKLDESAMPSTCIVFGIPSSTNIRGGSTASAAVAKNAVPMRCRLVPATVQPNIDENRLVTAPSPTVQIALTDLETNAVTIAQSDEIEVTTVLKAVDSDDDKTVVERYRVDSEPDFGSYSTNVPVKVTKIG